MRGSSRWPAHGSMGKLHSTALPTTW
jgi:hypothetical protein